MGERLEFYIYEGELWMKDAEGNNDLVDSSKADLLSKVLEKVQNDYPEAYKALQERYKDSAPNKLYYRYMMAVRFIKCNFATLDSTNMDMTDGRFNFERVNCPLRSECKYNGIICSPVFGTSLSKIEKKVCELWYKGLSKEEIGGMLYLSPNTINNHIRNAYLKLNVHDKAEFIRFADDSHLF